MSTQRLLPKAEAGAGAGGSALLLPAASLTWGLWAQMIRQTQAVTGWCLSSAGRSVGSQPLEDIWVPVTCWGWRAFLW